MSQRRAIIDGKYRWVDEGPAYAGSIKFGGVLVVGASASPEKVRQAEAAQKYRAKQAKP